MNKIEMLICEYENFNTKFWENDFIVLFDL